MIANVFRSAAEVQETAWRLGLFKPQSEAVKAAARAALVADRKARYRAMQLESMRELRSRRANLKLMAAKRGSRPSRYVLAHCRAMAAKHGVPLDAILSRTRVHDVFLARAEVFALSVDRHSRAALGRMWGMDHTSVLHALKRFAAERVAA